MEGRGGKGLGGEERARRKRWEGDRERDGGEGDEG